MKLRKKITKILACGLSVCAIAFGAIFGATAFNNNVDNVDHGAQLEIGNYNNNGIALTAFADEIDSGAPSAQAETSYRLTATVTPSNAVNKTLDWGVAWKNASSTWASGKTVTDYVTVTPTADGALTADVECKQAFGEQVIVTANVRGYTSIKATCTVDYRQKFLGSDVNVDVSITGLAWDLNYTNANSTVTVDYLDMAIGKGYGDVMTQVSSNSSTKWTSKDNWSTVYTIAANTTVTDNYPVVSASATYLAALESAGLTVDVQAGEEINMYNSGTGILNLLFYNFITETAFYETQALDIVEYLHNHSSETMLTIKWQTGTASGTNETVYNLKFSAASTNPVTLSSAVNLDYTSIII